MCGFIGTVSKNEIQHDKLEKCNEQLICRGPDKKKILEASEDSVNFKGVFNRLSIICLLYTSPSPRDRQKSRMPSSA